jgi:CheY-like chemotaxis protein
MDRRTLPMTSHNRSIAMLAGNPAFAAIFSRAMEDTGVYRVPVFESVMALSTFLRIAPVDVAVLNLDVPWNELVETAHSLKHAHRSANPLLDIIVLVQAEPLVAPSPDSGISAALTKPTTPAQLMAAIDKVLAEQQRPRPGHIRHVPAARRASITPAMHPIVERVGNVIPLFAHGRERG